MKKREITIPTLVGLLVVLGGLVSGLWLVQRQISQSSKAAAEASPREVVVANVTDVSFTVTWVTDKAMAGYVQYGESDGNPDLVVSDDRDQQEGSVGSYFTHFVTVRGLRPETAYKFKIGSGNRNFDQDGKPYEVRTGPILAEAPPADVAYGQVVTSNGEPADGALVYLTMAGGSIQAALAKASGSWVIPLSTIRTGSQNNYVLYDKAVTKLELTVNDGPMGMAKITTNTANDNPVPQIILGQEKDYTDDTLVKTPTEDDSGQTGSKLGQIPIPESGEKGIKLLSPQSGEGVNTSRPEIIGVAPANTEVTIEIHSEAIVSGVVTADRQGNFSFSVPDDLPPGEHTLIISAVVDGVIQRISRTFVVYAADESFDPAFSSTPSAVLIPTTGPIATGPTLTPTPVATVRPTSTPAPTPTIRSTATPTPRPSVTITQTLTPTVRPTTSPTVQPTPTIKPSETASLPASGGEDLTRLLVIFGMGLVVSGWWWYRKAV